MLDFVKVYYQGITPLGSDVVPPYGVKGAENAADFRAAVHRLVRRPALIPNSESRYSTISEA